MTTTAGTSSVRQSAREGVRLSPGELRALVGRHELDLAHRPAGRPCTACALFEEVGGAASAVAVAIEGHLYFPPVDWHPSGRHAHPTYLPSSASHTQADLTLVRALAEEVCAGHPEAQQALDQLRVRLDLVNPADPLTDRTAIAAAAALILSIAVDDADG